MAAMLFFSCIFADELYIWVYLVSWPGICLEWAAAASVSNSKSRMPELYLYRFNCRRWWGTVSDLQLVHLTGDAELLPTLLTHAQAVSGSQTCNVELLQKFELSMKVVETYGSMATLPVTAVEGAKK